MDCFIGKRTRWTRFIPGVVKLLHPENKTNSHFAASNSTLQVTQLCSASLVSTNSLRNQLHSRGTTSASLPKSRKTSTVIHHRVENKPFERRSPLSPRSAKALLEAGYIVRVERSVPDNKGFSRIYKDEEYEAVGAEMVPPGSWVDAPTEDIILGLKELPHEGPPLRHQHILFQHCFKRQDHWAAALSRFAKGGGRLYDHEFLVDESGRRVAAFGPWAGYAGTAIALMSWSHQILRPGVPESPVPVFDSAPALVEHVRRVLEPAVRANRGEPPRIIVIGALGRCGSGAVAMAEAAGVPGDAILKWDAADTVEAGGPFREVVGSDIFVNCVYLGPRKAPPFVTFESLATPGRRLRVICDVSCDPNSENNPIPVYSGYSSFGSPTIPTSERVEGAEVRVVAIDHLPTLVAREASDEFSALLLPSLLTLDRRDEEGVWKRAEEVYRARVREIPRTLA